MNPAIHRSASRAATRGMTLIEVLVGIVIGMIAMIAIFQVVTVWESRTRASTSSGDAQIAGGLAMFQLERDIKLAGMGFGNAGSNNNFDCVVNTFDNVASGTDNFSLRPVSITFGGPTAADQISVLYGNSAYLETSLGFSGGTMTTAQTDQKYGLKRGDVAVVAAGPTCKLVQITDDRTADDYIVTFAPGSYDSYYSGITGVPNRYNNAAASMPLITTGVIYSLGPVPHRNEWQVNTANNTLGFVNRMSTANVNQFLGVAEGVVDMKALYGYDANNDKMIDESEWTAANPADWTRVLAVRVAILVRSREYAKPNGASDAPQYMLDTASAPTWGNGRAFSTMKNLDGTADSDVRPSPNNWRYYRYRVYERVIPLRNMIWGTLN